MKKKNELGLLIKKQREIIRLTQRELAAELGVKASHVAYIEGGMRRPSLSLVRRLAETLGLNKEKLLLLSYPETRRLITVAPKPAVRDSEEVWQQFTSDRAIQSKHSITPAELKVLRQVLTLGRVAAPRNLLFVLNAIRQAVSDE